VAAVFEGLAPDFARAEAMFGAGEIQLKPAQDNGVVTPLAGVVSASMPLHSVYDAWRGQQRILAPINGGSGPAIRLGQRSAAALDHLRWINTRFADVLRAGIADGIALVPLAALGLKAGDDCHGRTGAATARLVDEIRDRTPGGVTDAAALAFMAASPSLFLNLWMAATKLMMRCAEGVDGASLITAAGANGREIGIQVAGLPGRWFTAPADPPRGRFDLDLPPERALGAIGDSAVIDAFGLGAMAIRHSPAQMAALGTFLPRDADRRIAALTAADHPDFRHFGIRLGTTARAAAATGAGPMIALGILDRLGQAGRIGGGIYDMPASPFAQALRALEG
jgi:hypothetical protein